jgi:hypothetical protein
MAVASTVFAMERKKCWQAPSVFVVKSRTFPVQWALNDISKIEVNYLMVSEIAILA